MKVIKSWPFVYWISDEFREKFGSASVADELNNGQGLITSDNNRFLRFHWEVNQEDIYSGSERKSKWVRYSKGGPYVKWHGNLWLVVNWDNNGHEIRTFVDDKGKQRSRPQNESFYFKPGVTYSSAGSKGASFRFLPENHIFDSGGSSIFGSDKFNNPLYILALMNSSLTRYVINCLNPTVNTQVGDIGRVPFIMPSKEREISIEAFSSRNVHILKYLVKFSLVEPEYTVSTLLFSDFSDLRARIRFYLNLEVHLLCQVLINEAVINEEIFAVYELTDFDKLMVTAKEGNHVGNLPVSIEARDAYLDENEATKEFSLDTIRDFIETLPIKVYADVEREVIEGGFLTLNQGNNTLEEFCIRHQVNPINVWYWFKQSAVIPQQRMHALAKEFMADLVREILMEDEDGIIPLVSNAGEKVLFDRIEEKFREKGLSPAQYSSFDSVLGRPINEYLNKYFFAELADYLKLFKQLSATPFIWHLTSGPDQGFDCYIIIYKWSRDNLLRLRSVYIENRERALQNRQSGIAGNESAEAQNEKERIFKQLREIDAFKKKIDELLAEGYNPILDDGVGKNIAPLQKKKMLAYDVLNAGQLKKYLNADW